MRPMRSGMPPCCLVFEMLSDAKPLPCWKLRRFPVSGVCLGGAALLSIAVGLLAGSACCMLLLCWLDTVLLVMEGSAMLAC